MFFARRLFLLGFCLLALSCARATLADGATPEDKDWLLHQATAPGTRFFSGTIENKFDVFLRLTSKPEVQSQFVGSYYVFSPMATSIEEISLDGNLENGKLELNASEWDDASEDFVTKSAFSLTGLSTDENASRLKGSWFQKGKARYVELRERKFELPGASSLVLRKIEKEFPRANYYVAMHFPQLSASGAEAAKFNRKIELLSFNALNTIKDASKNFDPPNLATEDTDMDRGKSYMVGATQFSFATNSIISGDLIQNVYYGGAHGGIWHSTFTYDFKRDRDLKLEEIFAPKSDYLKSLAFLCRGALHKSLGMSVGDDTEWLERGSAPTVANYSNWNITPTGLLITFSDYQVASYAQGESKVLIPYSKIKHIMKPEFYQRFTDS